MKYYIIANRFCVRFKEKFVEKFGCMDFDSIAEKADLNIYKKAQSKLTVYYSKKQCIDGLMEDGNYYYSDDVFVDTKLGVSIEKKDNCEFIIKASQDCPEWFMFICEIMLLKCGLTFAHSACIEKNGKAFFMPARGGVGKTATVVNMVRNHGWKLLGDDLVILDGENKCVFSYLKRFVIYGYHRDLFPEQFKGHHPVTDSYANHLIYKMVPTVKKVLRHFPGVLSYARMHNPQSMRILPKDIFKKEELAYKADKIGRTIWLERIAKGELECKECAKEEIASRCAAITLSELTYGSMNFNLCFFIMCGSGMLEYSDLYESIYKIILKCIPERCYILSIPKDVHVNELTEIVHSYSD